MPAPPSSSPAPVDRRSGYCAATRTFRSLRPAVALPEPSIPLSFPSFAFSLLPSPLPSCTAFVDASTGVELTHADFGARVRALSLSLCRRFGLVKGDVAFVLAPASIDIPVLYFALLSIGAVVAPANPVYTKSEISNLLLLARPAVAFAVSTEAHKLPQELRTVLLDSVMFQSSMSTSGGAAAVDAREIVPEETVLQSDIAALHYSSGTTGRVKAAAVAHRSLIAQVAGWHAFRLPGEQKMLLSAPMFHTMGFLFVLKSVALGETGVVVAPTGKGSVYALLRAAEKFNVTQMIASPPLVVALAKVAGAVRLPKLQAVVCGGAPMPPAAAERFASAFPHVQLQMGYGCTEGGGISRMICREECARAKSAGRLSENVEMKIVKHPTGESLTVSQEGEIRVRGPGVMKGYVGDAVADADAFDSDGWLKTGDLGYIDNEGFLYVVDRLKELIKYKAYQVAPAELEYVLLSHSGIADAAVVPCADEEAGQIPVALVVRKPSDPDDGSTLTQDEVINYVALQVAPYKRVRRVIFIKSIPRSPSGKILRRKLANLIMSNSSKL